jgi:hypothetical protein
VTNHQYSVTLCKPSNYRNWRVAAAAGYLPLVAGAVLQEFIDVDTVLCA